ncbi:MAG: hypothetical protein C4326_11170 [Ignavibacteria bacterium]
MLAPYAGFGGSISRLWSSTEYVYSDRTEVRRSYQNRVTGSVFIGAEYWFTKSISLAGEQSFTVSHASSESSTWFEAEVGPSTLLLSVYF